MGIGCNGDTYVVVKHPTVKPPTPPPAKGKVLYRAVR